MRSWGEGRRGADKAGARAVGRASARAGSSGVAGPCFLPILLRTLPWLPSPPGPKFQRGPADLLGLQPASWLILRSAQSCNWPFASPDCPRAFPPRGLCTGCSSAILPRPPSKQVVILRPNSLFILGVGGLGTPRHFPCEASVSLPPSPNLPAEGSPRSSCLSFSSRVVELVIRVLFVCCLTMSLTLSSV